MIIDTIEVTDQETEGNRVAIVFRNNDGTISLGVNTRITGQIKRDVLFAIIECAIDELRAMDRKR